MKLLLSVALLLCSVPAVSAPAAPPPVHSKIYAVVFRVTPDSAGGISDLQVTRVIDPSGPGTPEEVAKRPVDVAVPPVYVAAARKFLEGIERTKAAAGEQRQVYYAYTFYDPSQPDRADILADKNQ
jgi:hypothetical protein